MPPVIGVTLSATYGSDKMLGTRARYSAIRLTSDGG